MSTKKLKRSECTQSEAMEYLGVSEQSIVKLRNRGAVFAERRGRRWYYTRVSLDAFLREQEVHDCCLGKCDDPIRACRNCILDLLRSEEFSSKHWKRRHDRLQLALDRARVLVAQCKLSNAASSGALSMQLDALEAVVKEAIEMNWSSDGL